MRALVTVAEITSVPRGIGAEVPLDHVVVGLDVPSAVNCDGLHTVAQSRLTQRVGAVGDETMEAVCAAVGYTLGCRGAG